MVANKDLVDGCAADLDVGDLIAGDEDVLDGEGEGGNGKSERDSSREADDFPAATDSWFMRDIYYTWFLLMLKIRCKWGCLREIVSNLFLSGWYINRRSDFLCVRRY